MYTNIEYKALLKAIEYGIQMLQGNIPPHSRFTKLFILEGLWSILKYNYFHTLNSTIELKRRLLDVVSSNLIVVCFEIKLFSLLPQIFSGSFIDFFIHYFHFLDDVFHKWLADFNFELFYKLINKPNPDLQFIFENLKTFMTFLGIHLNITDNIGHLALVRQRPMKSLSICASIRQSVFSDIVHDDR